MVNVDDAIQPRAGDAEREFYCLSGGSVMGGP